MKTFIHDFIRRGLVASGFGPIILAIVYLILRQQSVIEMLTVREVTLGIFSLSALAFIAGGMNAVYQIERLPLILAIGIHGSTLYLGYLVTYLLNGWLEQGITPLLSFSGIFAAGYLAVWAVIYSITKRNTKRLNEALNKKRKNSEHP